MEKCLERLDPRIRRTRELLYVALRDLLAEKSFDEISVQDIAERSTVNRGTFYDHFTDKFELLEAMVGEKFRAEFEARMKGAGFSCREAQTQLVLTTCAFLSKAASSCQKHERQFEAFLEAAVKKVLREFLLEGMREQGVKRAEAELRATVASWSIYGAALQWSRRKATSPEALATSLLPLIHSALAAKHG